MKKIIISLVLFVLSAACMSATDGNNEQKYIIPDGSNWIFNNNKDGFYHFDGEAKVSVRYEISSHKDYKNLVITVHPDSESLKSLPYLMLFDSSKQEAKNIVISNSKDILSRFINEKTQQHLNRTNDVIHGIAILILNKLSGGYECDQLTFVVSVKNIISINANKKYMKIKRKDGC